MGCREARSARRGRDREGSEATAVTRSSTLPASAGSAALLQRRAEGRHFRPLVLGRAETMAALPVRSTSPKPPTPAAVFSRALADVDAGERAGRAVSDPRLCRCCARRSDPVGPPEGVETSCSRRPQPRPCRRKPASKATRRRADQDADPTRGLPLDLARQLVVVSPLF